MEKEGAYYNNYFYSRHTAHLLPNFYLLILKLHLLNDESGEGDRRRTDINQLYGNTTATYGPVVSINLLKEHLDKIPGGGSIGRKFKSSYLGSITSRVIKFTNWESPLERYLQLDHALLDFLYDTFSNAMKIGIGGPVLEDLAAAVNNNSLLVFEELENVQDRERIYEEEEAIVKPKRGNSAKGSQGKIAKAKPKLVEYRATEATRQMKFRLCSRYLFDEMAVKQTAVSPVVRICLKENQIILHEEEDFDIEYDTIFCEALKYKTNFMFTSQMLDQYIVRRLKSDKRTGE
jgi:hypothetical protein